MADFTTGIVSLNRAHVMDFFNVYIFTVPELFRVGRDLATGQFSREMLLPYVY